MSAYLPHDWPAEVFPPGTEDFEASAVAWLLDILPPDQVDYGTPCRYAAEAAALGYPRLH